MIDGTVSLPKILLLDDDPRELDKLSRLVFAYYAERARSVLSSRDLYQFRSGPAALEFLSGGEAPDIFFLDIVMPEMSGIQFAERIRAGGYKGYIVFMTSANDFASESFVVGAFSYLLKPMTKEQVFDTLRKIEKDRVRLHIEDASSVFVRTRQYSRNIFLREIMFVEIMGRRLSIHLVNDETVSFNKPLKEIAPELLADGRFFHCHNSIIVNMDQVENIRENDVVLKTGSAVPISRRCREFKSRYISYRLHKSKP